MMSLFERRKRSGMSQFLCAQRSGISRMRLSLAETGQIALSSEEETALSQTLTKYILEKAQEIALLQDCNSPVPAAGSFPEFGNLAPESYGVNE
jgi:transcriptional regulator with XRE-family HTH domain